MPVPPDNSPDWQALPPLVASTDAARLFGVKPRSLAQYVRRGQLAKPVQSSTNAAWYRREDLQAYWLYRQTKAAQSYSPAVTPPLQAPDIPETGRDLVLQGGVSLTPAALGEMLTEAVRRGAEEGGRELRGEIALLREEVVRLTQELRGGHLQEDKPDDTPATEPPTKTWWRRLTGK